MISIISVGKAYGPKRLFDDVNVTFNDGNRYGLTGPNGSGKSTLMKIMAGEEEPDVGRVGRPKRLGVLRQDHFRYDDSRVIDVVIMGNVSLWDALSTKERLLAQEEIGEAEGHKLADLEAVIAEEDGYQAEAHAAELLGGLGIDPSYHDQSMRALSGGHKLRVLLAQALFGKPQGLLLDEPTNHLDLSSIRWLEGFLNAYEGALVTISHDRHFLNAIATHIADIDYETVIVYNGDYDDMVRQKSQVRSRIEHENAEKSKKISELQDFVARFHAGTRASQVQSRLKAMEKLKLDELKRSNLATPFIKFEQKVPSGKQTLVIEKLEKHFGDSKVIQRFDALVTRGEKVCIIGQNGAGKTTLARLLAGELHPDGGRVRWGHQAQVGYLPQDQAGAIPVGSTAFEWLRSLENKMSNEEISGLLGRMLFSGDERQKPTATLSGGETVRLLMAKLMLLKDNVLIMDEPTNHLDLQSIAALSEGLGKFPGVVIMATHDQELIREVGTRIWSLAVGRPIVDFPGTFDEFMDKHGDLAGG